LPRAPPRRASLDPCAHALQGGADPNALAAAAPGESALALHAAVEADSPKSVALLLDAGAAPDAPCIRLRSGFRCVESALDMAERLAGEGRAKIGGLLRAHGAAPLTAARAEAILNEAAAAAGQGGGGGGAFLSTASTAPGASSLAANAAALEAAPLPADAEPSPSPSPSALAECGAAALSSTALFAPPAPSAGALAVREVARDCLGFAQAANAVGLAALAAEVLVNGAATIVPGAAIASLAGLGAAALATAVAEALS
jgi:hypothetical protein